MPVQCPLEDCPLDRWMQVALAERYGAALREPIPEALLKLLSDTGEN